MKPSKNNNSDPIFFSRLANFQSKDKDRKYLFHILNMSLKVIEKEGKKSGITFIKKLNQGDDDFCVLFFVLGWFVFVRWGIILLLHSLMTFCARRLGRVHHKGIIRYEIAKPVRNVTSIWPSLFSPSNIINWHLLSSQKVSRSQKVGKRFVTGRVHTIRRHVFPDQFAALSRRVLFTTRDIYIHSQLELPSRGVASFLLLIWNLFHLVF